MPTMALRSTSGTGPRHWWYIQSTYRGRTIRLEDEIVQDRFDDQYMKAILNVLVTADRLSAQTNAILKPFGISKEQFNVLRILRGQDGKAVSLLLVTERMISKSSNATRLVEKLRAKGLVERSRCQADRRQVDIRITTAGLDLLEKVDPLLRADGRERRRLSDKEARELNRLLDEMRG
jgi:DNA-binding MarR family transcriptional regulator